MPYSFLLEQKEIRRRCGSQKVQQVLGVRCSHVERKCDDKHDRTKSKVAVRRWVTSNDGWRGDATFANTSHTTKFGYSHYLGMERAIRPKNLKVSLMPTWNPDNSQSYSHTLHLQYLYSSFNQCLASLNQWIRKTRLSFLTNHGKSHATQNLRTHEPGLSRSISTYLNAAFLQFLLHVLCFTVSPS